MCFQVLKEVLIIFESDLYSPPLGVVPFSDVIKRTLLWVTAVEDNSKMKVLAFLSVLANAAYISKYRDYNSSPFIRQLRKLEFYRARNNPIRLYRYGENKWRFSLQGNFRRRYFLCSFFHRRNRRNSNTYSFETIT